MKLSIITINRNNVIGLKKSIDSVVEQSFGDFEYIIVDGASADGSVDLIKELSSTYKRDLKWVSEPDSGIYNAMNKGIKMASGEYLLFLNSGDCLADTGILEKIGLEEFEYDVICGNAIMSESKYHKEVLYNSPVDLRASHLLKSHLSHQASFIKKQLFFDICFYDETYRVISDWIFFIQALLFNNGTYKHIDLIISICETEGVSLNPSSEELIRSEHVRFSNESLKYFKDDYDELEKNQILCERLDYKLLMRFGQSFLFRLIFRIYRKCIYKYVK